MIEWKETEIGFIPNDWEIVDFENICETITDGAHMSPKEVESEYLMASVKDMRYDYFDFSNCKTISKEDFDYLVKNKCNPQKGDILLSKDGANCLDIIFVYNQKNKIVLLSSIAIARLKNDYNPFFYRYFLLSRNAQMLMRNRFISGSAIPRVVLKDFKKVPVPKIKTHEQNTIASILLSLDKKINLLRQQNQTLEQIAQTLFKRWFVDFEFPNENGQSYKASGGKMVESELGEIPEGWKVSSLKEISTLLTRGISPKYLEEGGIPVINQRCIRNKSINFALCRRHNNELKSAKSKFIQKGDVLINSTGVGTLGRTTIVRRLEETITTVDSHVTIVRPNIEIANKLFFGYLLTTKEREIEYLGEGSTGQTELSRTKLGELGIILPTKKNQNLFEDSLLTTSEKIASNEKEIETLTKLRNTLLPKLMSGEIRVNTSS